MREIKFRAWDIHTKEMKYDSVERIFYDYPETCIMQYTGLKDKNGKEIYEGDIVYKDNVSLWSVEWDNNTSSFIVYNQLNSDRNIFGNDSGVALFRIVDADVETEIIGNIYENPELLKQ